EGFDRGNALYVGENVSIDPEATVVGPGVIGDNTRIEAPARRAADPPRARLRDRAPDRCLLR
ncbi:MAG: hypothetical protein AAGD86_03435, partial [Pseudomonadota bacterium]